MVGTRRKGIHCYASSSTFCSNLAIDHHVFEASLQAGVEKVIFASTACVYPMKLQENVGSGYKLREEDSDPFTLDGFFSADIEYGWGKLMSESNSRYPL